jgi:putative FmdB family regulatory protein
MPTYQYACTSCGERLEVVQKFSDDPLAECPACGGALRKVFSAVGVVFKGSGFYKTDSRKSTSSGEKKADGGKDGATKQETAAKADGAKSGGSKSEGGKSSDSKPASTTSTPAAKSA